MPNNTTKYIDEDVQREIELLKYKNRLLESEALKLNYFNEFIITHHKINHKFRDTLFRMSNCYTYNHLDDCFNSFTEYTLNKLSNLMRIQTEQPVSVCLKILELKNNVFDYDTARVRKVRRSTNSMAHRRTYDKNHKPSLIKDNTCYKVIFDANSAKSHFYVDNLDEYTDYKNPNPHRASFYKSTIVAPIRIENTILGVESDTPFDIVGFLCIDSLSTSAFTYEKEGINMELIYSFADLFYIIIKKYQEHLHNIKNGKVNK